MTKEELVRSVGIRICIFSSGYGADAGCDCSRLNRLRLCESTEEEAQIIIKRIKENEE